MLARCPGTRATLWIILEVLCRVLLRLLFGVARRLAGFTKHTPTKPTNLVGGGLFGRVWLSEAADRGHSVSK